MAKRTYAIGSTQYRIKIVDHILDNVYGVIGLSEAESNIEKLPIFKRLHDISQLGLVNRVFPCASHSRYSHSIGVMYVAGQMAEHINQSLNSFFDESDIQIIRLAGLLHDIGHYPMSHNVEQAYKKVSESFEFNDKQIDGRLNYYINCPEFLNPLRIEDSSGMSIEENSQLDLPISGSTGLHHENIGFNLISKNKTLRDAVLYGFILIEESGSWVLNPKFAPQNKEIDINQEYVEKVASTLMLTIGNMVKGNYAYVPSHGWDERYSAMIQLLHSELDADNLDYLVRDSKFSGTSYGIMDVDILLNNLIITKISSSNCGDNQYRYIVGIKEQGLSAVAQFFINKFFAYTQMTLSKHVSILEAMLVYLEMYHVIERDEVYGYYQLQRMVEKETTEPDFLRFSDHYVYKKIMELSTSGASGEVLYEAIVSYMQHYSSFGIASNDSECFCTGFDYEEIKTEIEKYKVYQDFKSLCMSLKKSGTTELNEKLFAFRFESFNLTKQKPINVFIEEYKLNDFKNTGKRFEYIYYRLGDGIPVIRDNEYVVDCNKKDFYVGLPLLCIECPQALLHKMYQIKYVSLRKYNILKYSQGIRL